MPPLLDRLRDRKLVQWALAYLGTAWLVVQVLGEAADTFSLPPVLLRLSWVVLGAGLVAALVLAWYHGEKGAQRVSGVEALLLVMLLVSAGAGITWVRQHGASPPSVATASRAAFVSAHPVAADHRSVAVLPFTNLSADPENAYFAAGVQYEILTQLAKIGGLKVISRSSVMRYEHGDRDLAVIGRDLGVASVLEGSVQRVGSRIRVQAQLVDTRTHDHLGAERYDRDVTDVFAIQSDIAQQITTALHTTLTRDEREQLKRAPTASPEAYSLYLRARVLHTRRLSQADHEEAIRLLEQAVRIDPTFALAYAQLAGIRIHGSIRRAPAVEARARAEIDRALALEPNLPEARFALANYHYTRLDFDSALNEATRALAGLPNDALLHNLFFAIYRKQARWEEAIASARRAATLDPGGWDYRYNLASTYIALRRYREAERTINEAYSTGSDVVNVLNVKGHLYVAWRGGLDTLRALAARHTEDKFWPVHYQLYAYERRWEEAIQRLPPAPPNPWGAYLQISLPLALARAYEATGDRVQARIYYDSALVSAEQQLRENPELHWARQHLSLALLGLGRGAEALREARGLVEARPMARDAREGPFYEATLAEILARTGEAGEALEVLARLVHTPYGPTVHELRLDPRWDPLRGNPGFRHLLQGQHPN